MAADTMVMLDLLEEAGDEAVTLDELEVAGVRDPVRALFELEVAGLEIQRVLVSAERAGATHECVRLAQPRCSPAPVEQPTVELAAVASRHPEPPEPPEPPETPVAATSGGPSLRGLFALGVLLALLALALRRS